MFDAFARWLAARGRAVAGVAHRRRVRRCARRNSFATPAGARSSSARSTPSRRSIRTDWAESDPAFPLEFPGCYYTAGVLADFFGRLAGEPLAVMEVECRSMGGDRCRFLVGSGETMQRVYDDDGAGRRVRAGGGG